MCRPRKSPWEVASDCDVKPGPSNMALAVGSSQPGTKGIGHRGSGKITVKQSPGHDERSVTGKRRRSDSVETVQPVDEVQKRGRPDEVPSEGSPGHDDLYACLFCKGMPDHWGDLDNCLAWRNKNIGTVIRHHVLGKHKELNDTLKPGDPRRIDPNRFVQLQEWKDKVRLEKRKGKELWIKAYMILFSVEKSEKDKIPSPYFSSDHAHRAVNQLQTHLNDRAIDDPLFVEHDMQAMLLKTKNRELQRDAEKGFIREYFGLRIRGLKQTRDFELRRAEERCKDDVEQYQKPIIGDLTAPQRTNSDEFVAGAGSVLYHNVGLPGRVDIFGHTNIPLNSAADLPSRFGYQAVTQATIPGSGFTPSAGLAHPRFARYTRRNRQLDDGPTDGATEAGIVLSDEDRAFLGLWS